MIEQPPRIIERGFGERASADGHSRRQRRDTGFAELLARMPRRSTRGDEGEDRLGVPLDGIAGPPPPVRVLPARYVAHFARRVHTMATEARPGAQVFGQAPADGVEVELAVEMLDSRRVSVVARVADRALAHVLQKAEEELRHALSRWGLELARFEARGELGYEGRRNGATNTGDSASTSSPVAAEPPDAPMERRRPRHSYVEVIV